MTRRQQQSPPTVGDTLTIVHRVSVPDGALVQPRGPADSSLATLVGVPDVRREGDSVRIAYTIAVWAPGRNDLVIPGAIVVDGAGRVDTLPDAAVRLEVASVLPRREAVESIAPRAARPWVERSGVSPIPFVVLLLPLALLLAGVAVWWRRRGTPPAAAVPRRDSGGDANAERIERWLEAGEVALAVDHLAAALPQGPAADEWREATRRLRFDPDALATLAAHARDGLALLRGGKGH